MNETKKKQKVVILGCGWLGKIVGEDLVKSGFDVFGSSRSEKNSHQIQELGIEPFYLDINHNSQISTEIIDNTSYVLIFFPPSIENDSFKYHEILLALATQFHNDARFILTSSTGVYPQKSGIFDENYVFAEEEQSNRLKIAEDTLRYELGDRLTIFRPGGLIGPDRHPIYSLQGREISHDGSAPVNLVQGKDISRATQKIIESGIFGRTFNLVFPLHPTKKEYYQKAAETLELEPPKFGTRNALNRQIMGKSIQNEISFQYNHPIDNFLDFKR